MTLCAIHAATTGEIRYEGEELTGLTTAEIICAGYRHSALKAAGVFAPDRGRNLSMGGFFTHKG